MAALKQHALALSLIALLVLIKFVIIPTLAWQELTISSNQLLQQRLNKSSYALNNEIQMQSDLIEITAQLLKIKAILFNYQSKSRFQLTEQKKLESLFEQHNIEITRLAWKLELPLPQWQVVQHEIRFDIKGLVVDLQKLQATLDSRVQWYNNDDFNFKFDKRRGNKLGKVTGRMTIKLYMKEKS